MGSVAHRLSIGDNGGAIARKTALDKWRDALLVDGEGFFVLAEGRVVCERAVVLTVQAEHGQVVHRLQVRYYKERVTQLMERREPMWGKRR
eukprot:1192004-Prorocentrum_minimum.AAC.3